MNFHQKEGNATMTALIIDDEPLTREILRTRLPWNELGFTTVLEAENGRAALETMNHTPAQVIISDIRMPDINGIDFACAVRRSNINCQLIFISGYCEKEYLKSAIHLGAADFIEKPLNLAEVTESLRRVAQRVHEQTSVDFQQLLKQQHEESVAVTEFFVHSSLAWDDFSQRLCKNSTSGTLEVFIMQMKTNLSEAETLLSLKKTCRGFGLLVSGYVGQGMYVLLHRGETSAAAAVQTYLRAHSACGGYSICTSFTHSGLCKAYETAQQILNNYFFENCFDLFMIPLCARTPVDEIDTSTITNALSMLDFHELREGMNALFCAFAEMSVADIPAIRHKLCTLGNAMQHIVSSILNDTEFSFFPPDFLQKTQTMPTLHSLQAMFLQAVDNICQGVTQRHYSPSIMQAIRYLQLHYSNPNLNIRTIADAVYLSPAYLCSRFKKELHLTINTYLHHLRIHQATALLKNNALSLTEISFAVGYCDANYFSKLFKRSTGMSPSEYREKTSNLLFAAAIETELV